MSKNRPPHYATLLEEGIHLFRQCENILPIIYSHLTALENISKQKRILIEAARRQRFHAHYSHLGNEDSASLTSRSSSSSSTTPVVAVAPPLGVLSLFPPSQLELLVSQHQTDETELLSTLSQRESVFRQKVNDLVKLLEGESPVGVDDAGTSSEADYSTYYRHTTRPVPHAVPPLTPEQQAFNEVCHLLHDLLSILLRYSHVLQESIFVLRDALLFNAIRVGPSMEKMNSPEKTSASNVPTVHGAALLYQFIHHYRHPALSTSSGRINANNNNNNNNDNGKTPLEELDLLKRDENIFTQLLLAGNDSIGVDKTLGEGILDLKQFLEDYWDRLKSEKMSEKTTILMA